MKERKKNGFTLIELLIYLAIFVILITAITVFSVTTIKTIRKSQIRKEVVNAAYSAMRTMLYEIKAAANVYNPTSVFNVSPGQLSLQTAEYLPLGENLTYIDFYLDSDNKLYLKKEGQDAQSLISDKLNIANLEFEYFASSSELVKINLTISYDVSNPEYQYSYSLSSSAGVRE
jgi:prepilin-type N-terminal cleavage/methylation domain-containing protein